MSKEDRLSKYKAEDDEKEDNDKKDLGGANLIMNFIEGPKKTVEKILNYDNKNPESPLEQFLMPKERFPRKAENPESDDVELDFSKIDTDVMKKIENSDFKEYTQEYVKERTFWGKKLTVDQILSYSKNLHGPILNLSKAVEGLALKNFKRVVALINEKVTKVAAINIMKRMVKMAVKNSAELRDEMYFQIIKCVRNNNIQESKQNAWGLLCVISCFICPSESSVYSILNYLKYVIENDRDDNTRRSARFAFVRILRGFMTKGRGVLPCTGEIEQIQKKRKLCCRINLFTGGYLTVFYENYTVISDILKQICVMMGIDKERFTNFGLFEVTTKPGGVVEEAFIEEFIKLADVVASWEHERLFYQKKLGLNIEAKITLYVKIRFFFPMEISNFRDSLLLYNEACYIFKYCHCNVTPDELIELMGTHLQIFFSDHTPKKAEEIRKYLYEQIPEFEAKVNFKGSKEDLVGKIMTRYSEKTGKKRHECRLAFVDILSQKDTWLRNFYTAKVDATSMDLLDLKENLILGLGETSMTLFSTKYERIKDFTYLEMQKWGYSDVLLSILHGKEEDVGTKIVFQTTLSTDICHTLATYAELMMGISPKENALVVSATSKMIIAATEFFKRVNKFQMASLAEEDSDEEIVEDKSNKIGMVKSGA